MNAIVDSLVVDENDMAHFTYFDPNLNGGSHLYSLWTLETSTPITLISSNLSQVTETFINLSAKLESKG